MECALCCLLSNIRVFFLTITCICRIMNYTSEVCLLLTTYIKPTAEKHKLLSGSSDAKYVTVMLKFLAKIQPSPGSELRIHVSNEHVIVRRLVRPVDRVTFSGKRS